MRWGFLICLKNECMPSDPHIHSFYINRTLPFLPTLCALTIAPVGRNPWLHPLEAAAQGSLLINMLLKHQTHYLMLLGPAGCAASTFPL